jgi:hypothetical protein
MRVCQFRHYGTVFYAPHRGPEHANRELLVLQTEGLLSIPAAPLAGFVAQGWRGRMRGVKFPATSTRLLLKKSVYCAGRLSFSLMTEQNKPLSQAPSDVEKIPEDLSVEMRRIAHDLSNALEIIIQTSYLLSTTEMKEPASDWLRMLEDGVQKAMGLNLELRNYIKKHTSS